MSELRKRCLTPSVWWGSCRTLPAGCRRGVLVPRSSNGGPGDLLLFQTLCHSPSFSLKALWPSAAVLVQESPRQPGTGEDPPDIHHQQHIPSSVSELPKNIRYWAAFCWKIGSQTWTCIQKCILSHVLMESPLCLRSLKMHGFYFEEHFLYQSLFLLHFLFAFSISSFDRGGFLYQFQCSSERCMDCRF